jgi:hypothetical protein
MTTLAKILNGTFSEEETKVASQHQTYSGASEDDLMKVATELGLYNEIFPEDANLGNVKTAQEEKIAAYQSSLGVRTGAYCFARLDQRLEKIANEVLGSSDMAAAQNNLIQARPPTEYMGNNDASDAAPRMPVGLGSTPYAMNLVAGHEVGAEGDVGHYEQQKTAMAFAVEKLLLQRQLGK